MPEILSYRAFLLTMPLHRPIPVGGSRWSHRSVVLLRGEDAEGRTAWGEAAPLDGFGPDRLIDVRKALGHPDWDSRTMPPSLACALGTIRMGLEAVGQQNPFGKPGDQASIAELRPAVLLDGLSLDDPLPEGATHVKIKVGRADVETDSALVRDVCEAHPHVAVRLDGNGLCSRSYADDLLGAVHDLHGRIDYFEEPWEHCFREDIHDTLPVVVAIDESLAGDNWRHADACVMKPSLMGDPAATLALARRIQDTGRRVTVSSAFESQVGMIMLSRLAALIGDAAPGLGTYRFIADDWGGRADYWDSPAVDLNNVPAVPRLPMDIDSGLELPVALPSGLTVEEIAA